MAYRGEDRPMRDEDWAAFGGLFTQKEFACKCGNCDIKSANNMRHDFMQKLYLTRITLNVPFVINSGWRCADHPNERNKHKPGDHYYGRAADVGGSYSLPVRLTATGFSYGLNVFGWNHKGPMKGRFTHVALRKGVDGPIGYTY